MSTSGMEEPKEYDIVIKKGAEFSLPLVLEDEDGPMDLTGWSFKSQLLTAPNGTVLLTFDVVETALSAGSVLVFAAASSTGAIPATAAGGYKDAVPPQKFYPGYWDFFGAPSSLTATSDQCYLQGIGKVYPRGTVR